MIATSHAALAKWNQALMPICEGRAADRPGPWHGEEHNCGQVRPGRRRDHFSARSRCHDFALLDISCHRVEVDGTVHPLSGGIRLLAAMAIWTRMRWRCRGARLARVRHWPGRRSGAAAVTTRGEWARSAHCDPMHSGRRSSCLRPTPLLRRGAEPPLRKKPRQSLNSGRRLATALFWSVTYRGMPFS